MSCAVRWLTASSMLPGAAGGSVRYALALYLGHLDEHVSERIEWLLEDAASSAASRVGEVRSIRGASASMDCNESIDAG